jgi:hypothetical protein
LHFNLVLQLTLAEDFDPGKMTANEIRFAQKLFIYDCAGLKRVEVTHVNNSEALLKRCVIESALWQSSNERHLSAFEAEPDAPTGPRLLALGALPAGFPVSRAFAAAKAFDAMARARARAQIM